MGIGSHLGRLHVACLALAILGVQLASNQIYGRKYEVAKMVKKYFFKMS